MNRLPIPGSVRRESPLHLMPLELVEGYHDDRGENMGSKQSGNSQNSFTPSRRLVNCVAAVLNALNEKKEKRLRAMPRDETLPAELLEVLCRVTTAVVPCVDDDQAREFLVSTLRDYWVTVADALPQREGAAIVLTHRGKFLPVIEEGISFRMQVGNSRAFFDLLAAELRKNAESTSFGNDTGVLTLDDNGELVMISKGSV